MICKKIRLTTSPCAFSLGSVYAGEIAQIKLYFHFLISTLKIPLELTFRTLRVSILYG